MAISNYTELQTAIASWLHRDDLTSVIPDFIKLAEARLSREIHALNQQVTTTVTLTSGTDSIAYPTGFRELVDLYYTVDELQPGQVAIDQLNEVSTTAPGKPNAFALTNTIKFNQPADQNYSITIVYKQKLDLATDTTNWLLTEHPDAYLYPALVESAPYVRNDPRLATWEAKAMMAVRSVNNLRSRSRAPLVTEVAELNNNYFDIDRGY